MSTRKTEMPSNEGSSTERFRSASRDQRIIVPEGANGVIKLKVSPVPPATDVCEATWRGNRIEIRYLTGERRFKSEPDLISGPFRTIKDVLISLDEYFITWKPRQVTYNIKG